jgi:hypothetical protein
MAWRLAVAALLILAAPGAAWAGDPFASLSLQDRSIARALYAAQDHGPGMRALSLDQIATLKVIGDSWDEIFIGMRADGLVHAPDLASLIRGGDPGNAAARPQPSDPQPVAQPAAEERPAALRTAPASRVREAPPRVSKEPPPQRHRYGGRDVGIFDAFGRPYTAD